MYLNLISNPHRCMYIYTYIRRRREYAEWKCLHPHVVVAIVYTRFIIFCAMSIPFLAIQTSFSFPSVCFRFYVYLSGPVLPLLQMHLETNWSLSRFFAAVLLFLLHIKLNGFTILLHFSAIQHVHTLENESEAHTYTQIVFNLIRNK